MSTNVRLTSPTLFLAVILFTSAVTAPLRAQDRAETESSDQGDLYELSLKELMEVSVFQLGPADAVGYQAEQSITVTRTARPRFSLPLPITVLTEDLLEDIRAYDIEDAVRYMGSVNKRFAERDMEVATIRGFGATQTPRLRNGLIVQGYTDTVNWRRIEVIKGSPSVLYGQTYPSGIINTVTKRPSFKHDYRAAVTYGSYDQKRLELELTGPLGSSRRLAFRYAGAFTERNSEEKHEHLDKIYHAPSLTWRILENLTLTLDYEYLERDWTPSQGPALTRDQNGFLRHDEDFGGGREDAEWRGPDDYFYNDHSIFNAFLEWNVTDHINYRLSYADSEYYRDVYARNPGFLFTVPTDPSGKQLDANDLQPGEPASHIGHVPVPTRRTIEKTTSEQIRHDLQFDFDVLQTHHSVVLSHDHFRIKDGENPNSSAYDWSITPPWDPQNPRRNNPDGSVGWPKMPESAFATSGNDISVNFTEKGFDAWSLGGMSAALDEKLNVNWGVRYDELVNPSIKETTYRLGASYELVQGLRVFANWGTSFLDNGRGRFNQVLSPEEGKSMEGGTKFNFKDGRLTGSLSLFEIERTGIKHTVGVFDMDGDKIGERSIVSGEEKSQGVDLNLTLQLTDNWHTFVSASLLDSEVLANEAQPEEVGLTPQFAAEEMAGVFTRYDFTKGWLEGLSVGLGANYRGEVRLGNAVNKNWTQRADSRLLLDALMRYSFNLGSLPASVSLNVTNLTDREYVDRWQGWGEPRWISLTLRCAL